MQRNRKIYFTKLWYNGNCWYSGVTPRDPRTAHEVCTIAFNRKQKCRIFYALATKNIKNLTKHLKIIKVHHFVQNLDQTGIMFTSDLTHGVEKYGKYYSILGAMRNGRCSEQVLPVVYDFTSVEWTTDGYNHCGWWRLSRDLAGSRDKMAFRWNCSVVSTSWSTSPVAGVRSPWGISVYVAQRTGSRARTCWRRRTRCRDQAAPVLCRNTHTQQNTALQYCFRDGWILIFYWIANSTIRQ